MKNGISAILFSLLVLVSFSFCKRKQADNELITPSVSINVDSIFADLETNDLAKKHKTADAFFTNLARSGMNGVVLYAEQGQVVYKKAFGVRELNRRHPDSLRVDDQFQLSSDSKMFTAEAVMILYAQGKLDYDADVRTYIPEFPYEGVTVRHLLNHRSGLPRYDAMADEFWPDRSKPFSNEEMIKMLAERKPEVYASPDVTFFYNNINYALLASVVERVSGQHFEDFMRENIFEPLGMDRSYIYSMRNDSMVSLYMDCPVQGHELYRKGAVKEQNDYLNGVMGDKIMFSTVDDIYKFMMALDCNLLLPDSIQCEAFKPGSDFWKRGENYGFGWRMSEKHPGAVYHYGWWKGYRSAVIRNVAQNRVLIILTNTTYNLPGEILWEFVTDSTCCSLPESSWNPKVVRFEFQQTLECDE
ncbi:MAG: beta-lactamase family protein [Bacteroidales bacterium]|nr:beta-lactamase family protein [Bacteroidales bacterium]